MEKVGVTFNYKEITLSKVKELEIKEYLNDLADISERAKKENRLEKLLDKMESEWEDKKFELTTFRDSEILIF